MQLFVLHTCSDASARKLCDAHVVKMMVETLQILYTSLRANGCAWVDKSVSVPKSIPVQSRKRKNDTHNTNDTDDNYDDKKDDTFDDQIEDASDDIIVINYVLAKPYSSTHTKNPCILWTSACDVHFEWTLAHGLAIADEYSKRYGKRSKCHYHLYHIQTFWKLYGWNSPRNIPHILTAEQWLDSLAPTLRDNNRLRIASTNAPNGCLFGVVCMDPEHRLVHSDTDDRSSIDLTGSYSKFYDYKRHVAFKRPMKWSRRAKHSG